MSHLQHSNLHPPLKEVEEQIKDDEKTKNNETLPHSFYVQGKV